MHMIPSWLGRLAHCLLALPQFCLRAHDSASGVCCTPHLLAPMPQVPTALLLALCPPLPSRLAKLQHLTRPLAAAQQDLAQDELTL